MKIFWRIALGLALFYFVAGIVGLAFDKNDQDDFKQSATIGGSVAMIVLAAAAAAAVRDKREEDEQEQRSPAIKDETKLAICREASLVAALLERLASERYLQEKELPPGVQIVTRRVLLDRLMELGLRDELEPWLNDLLLAPDGHWTNEQKHNVNATWEYFAALWWVMGNGELQALTLQPKYSHADTRAALAITQPARLRFIPSWDIRPSRDAAGYFAHASWAELLARKAIPGISDEQAREEIEFCKQMQSHLYTEDSLIPGQCIPRYTTPDLWILQRRALHRWQGLSLLVEVLGGHKPASFLRDYLASYLAPQPDGEGSAPQDET
jgi:hypothetical protein